MFPIPVIAQADITGLEGLTAFQQKIIDQSQFIAILYGSIFVAGFVLLAVFTLRIQTRPLSWTLPLQRLAERPWDWHSALRLLIPLVLIQILFGLGYAWYDPPSHISPERIEKAVVALQGFLFHGMCFGLIASWMYRHKLSWSGAFGLSGRNLARPVISGVLILIGVMPLIIAYNISAQMILQWWGLPPQVQEVTRIISGASGWPAKVYFVALALGVAPVVEEMLFRGVLLPAIARVVGIRPALIVVALLFALVHGLYFPSAVIFFILSLAFSLAYIYQGSLLAPIAMHSLFNGLTMVVLLRM